METGQKKSKKKSKETGRWTKEQHSRFILGLVNFGKNWKKVEELVATRTGAQVRSHAQKFFNRLSKVKQNFFSQSEQDQQATLKASLAATQLPLESSEPLSKPLNQEHENEDDTSSDQTQQKQIQPHSQINSDQSNVTTRILDIIKKQSQDGKKPIQYKNFINIINQQAGKLQNDLTCRKSSAQIKEQIKQNVQHALICMQSQRKQMKNFSYLLIAYITLYGDKLVEQDKSFFEKLIKFQRRYICSNHFFDLVDIPLITETKSIQNKSQTKSRKKSFTLFEHSDQFKESLHKVSKMAKTQTTDQLIPVLPIQVIDTAKEQKIEEVEQNVQEVNSPQVPSA